jgi:hypothetical protein
MPGFGPVTGIWIQLLLIILGIIFLWKGNWDTLRKINSAQELPVGSQESAELTSA